MAIIIIIISNDQTTTTNDNYEKIIQTRLAVNKEKGYYNCKKREKKVITK
jgi:hypothetical protein